MQLPRVFPQKFLLAILLAGLLLTGTILSIRNTASARFMEPDRTSLQGDWDSAFDAWNLYVPPTMTLVITGAFLNTPVIIGPGPGVLFIEDIIIDGHLVIVDEAINYGPVEVNGRLTISGSWDNLDENRYACGLIMCVSSHVEGYVTNRGQLFSHGNLFMPFGATNEGEWRNTGMVCSNGTLINRGQFTNTGTISVAGVMRNMGQAYSPGLLVNQGVIFNSGLLTGIIENDGIIYSTGILSATIEGDGPVYLLSEHAYLPQISR